MSVTFPLYLGDGVYASFDGYQVWLHLGSHEAPALIALDPDVMAALNRYWAMVSAPVIEQEARL